ncbi:MAG: hypothetical protein ABI624_25675 [Casimicrobiaceae bacterium]
MDAALTRDLASGKYAFIDGGCADGASLDHCERRFGKRPGLGLDWYGADLEVARRRGFAVAHCNVMAEEYPPRCVSYASMLDFLEHLPDEASAVTVMRKLAAAAQDFIFIRHPGFDDIDYLAGFGLKLTWTDWPSHTNMMKIADYRRVFAALGWSDYVVLPHMRIADSRHPAIVPASAAPDTQHYDATRHGPKPEVRFDRAIYAKYDIFVRLSSSFDDETWRRTASIDGWEGIWV